VNYNLAPAGPGAVDPRRPYASLYPAMSNATVLANVASSTYDAAQFVFNRRYKDGLTFTTHYTWAHAQETRRTPWDFSVSETGDTPNFDVRHHFVLTTNYQLPWGQGLTGVAHGFLSNWQINAAAFWQSGVAFTVVNAASRTNTGGADRPIVTGDPMLPKNQRTVERWFNTAAFSAAPQFTPGNVGYALMHGPDQRRIDLSIFKDLTCPILPISICPTSILGARGSAASRARETRSPGRCSLASNTCSKRTGRGGGHGIVVDCGGR
jgi:hypothetical protein